jgi:FAD:protein FMN transferase
VIETFACFGATCTVDVDGHGAAGARRALLSWHERFTRFDPGSELSRFNADPRDEVPVSPLMARLAAAARWAAEASGGLVDATLIGDLERAGYADDLPTSLDLREALARAPARAPARPAPDRPTLAVDFDRMTVRRPPGVRLDPGGLAKGVFADVLAETLAGRLAFAVDCAGDLRVGGRARLVHVRGPFDGEVLYTFRLAEAGVATSGIGRRSWVGPDGRPAHHLLDPATGRPAYTGVVQATAIAATAVEAEVRAKAAVLAGPDHAAAWLPHGGIVVHDDGSHVRVQAAPRGGRLASTRAAMPDWVARP